MSRGRTHRAKLIELMNKKEVVGDVFNQLRLALQRRSRGRAAQVHSNLSSYSQSTLPKTRALSLLSVDEDNYL